MQSFLGIALGIALWASLASAATSGPSASALPSADLPTFGSDERQLYQRHPDTGRFSPVPVGSERAKWLYVRWHFGHNQWVWVTGDDRRMILPGSKTYGERLGLPGIRGLNWFLLDPPAQWRRVTDRVPCRLHREDPTYGVVISESCPTGWEEWGGEIDPFPGYQRVACTITATPPEVAVNQETLLEVRATGDASRAKIDGYSVTVPVGRLYAKPHTVGPRRAVGTVSGNGGTASCEVWWRVTDGPPPPPVGAPTCRLTADPSRIGLGQSLTLRVELEGSATSLEIDGTSVTLKSPSRIVTPPRAGRFTARARVAGPGGASTCEADYEVTETATTAPECTLTAEPATGTVGRPLKLVLQTTGEVTEAEIEGSPVSHPRGEKIVVPSSAGRFPATGGARGPGGLGVCRVEYEVKEAPEEKPPSCEITAEPARLSQGQSLQLTLVTSADATAAEIDGQMVAIPRGQRKITPLKVGTFFSTGIVRGAAGTGVCRVQYVVDPAQEQPPQCRLTATPAVVKLGQSLELVVSTIGNVTAATIEGSPVSLPAGKSSVTPKAAGSHTARATVTGPGGRGDCFAEYVVEAPASAPSCTLSATPAVARLGHPVTLVLKSQGGVSEATIDGTAVATPEGQRVLTPTEAGSFKATGRVRGAGGEATCEVGYRVEPQPSGNPPTCKIEVSPASVKAGQSVIFHMTTDGEIAEAVLDGAAVDFPSVKKSKTVPAGQHVVLGTVKGPGGTGTCWARYEGTP